jgi:hypothetical protein
LGLLVGISILTFSKQTSGRFPSTVEAKLLVLQTLPVFPECHHQLFHELYLAFRTVKFSTTHYNGIKMLTQFASAKASDIIHYLITEQRHRISCQK